MEFLSNLNPEQKEAVTSISGPLLVFAGAGSGKTRVLTHRIAYLIYSKIADPWQIMAVTFTNKAAGEMKERVSKLLGINETPQHSRIMLGTFHSVALRILRKEAASSRNNLQIDPSFVIYDTQDQLHLVLEIERELSIDEKRYPPKGMLAQISNAKNQLTGIEEYAKQANNHYLGVVSKIYNEYQRRLRENRALDFDDLIMETALLFNKDPLLLTEYQNRFKYILVDEYQDLNSAQYTLVKQLAKTHRNLCVVGDDDQSIYSFRGADTSLIYKFKDDFPDAKVVKLEQNYRSTKNILNLANSLVSNNSSREKKSLWTTNSQGELTVYYEAMNEREEARYVMEQIIKGVRVDGRSYSDYVILYRTNAQSRNFEELFLQEGVSYTIVGGLRFYDRKEIKDIIAYLKVLANPYDSISFKRIVNVPHRHIGPATLGKMLLWAQDTGEPLFNSVFNMEFIHSFPTKTKNAILSFKELLSYLLSVKNNMTVTELVQVILDKSKYMEELEEEGTEEALSRVDNLHEFLTVTQEFEQSKAADEDKSLESFLANVLLSADIDSWEDWQDAVTLMTLHSAKGLEFPVVFMVGLEERLFPHSRSLMDRFELEEERRLCYVGITRAQEKLHLTRAHSRMLNGIPSNNQPSRFLEELPSNLLHKKSQLNSGVHYLQNQNSKQDSVTSANTLTSFNTKNSLSSSNSSPFYMPKGPREGDRFTHPELGTGIVVSNRRAGTDEEITVAFNEHGIKRFLLNEITSFTA